MLGRKEEERRVKNLAGRFREQRQLLLSDRFVRWRASPESTSPLTRIIAVLTTILKPQPEMTMTLENDRLNRDLRPARFQRSLGEANL
jgi:hypothetical protein